MNPGRMIALIEYPAGSDVFVVDENVSHRDLSPDDIKGLKPVDVKLTADGSMSTKGYDVGDAARVVVLGEDGQFPE